MTVYMLNRGSSVRIQRSRLTLSTSRPSDTFTIDVTGTDGAEVDHISPAPEIVVVPDPQVSFDVTVRSTAGEFPRGTLIHPNVSVLGVGHAEADEVRLAEGIDLAGLTAVTILHFDVTDAGIEVHLPTLPTAVAALSAGAEAVRVETRRQMGNAPGEVRPVIIALDASGSAHALSQQHLKDTLDLVVGYASSTTSDANISGALVSNDYVPITAKDYSQLPQAMVERLHQTPLRSSVAVTTDAFMRTLPPDSLVIFVSDALPADFMHLAECRAEVRLVVMMSQDAWAVESAGITIPVPAAHLDVVALANLPEAHREAARSAFVQSLSQSRS